AGPDVSLVARASPRLRELFVDCFGLRRGAPPPESSTLLVRLLRLQALDIFPERPAGQAAIALVLIVLLDQAERIDLPVDLHDSIGARNTLEVACAHDFSSGRRTEDAPECRYLDRRAPSVAQKVPNRGDQSLQGGRAHLPMPAGEIAGLDILVAKRWFDRIEAYRDQDISLASFLGLFVDP